MKRSILFLISIIFFVSAFAQNELNEPDEFDSKKTSVKLNGKDIQIKNYLPELGTQLPCINLVKSDLSEVSWCDYKGKRIVLNIFPSLDTQICATSVRKFNTMVSELDNTIVFAISKDLPFASSRFCTTEGIKNVLPLSAFRDNSFGETVGVEMTEGPLKGLFARAIIVLDENGKVIYEELVPEIKNEPDYESVLEILAE